MGKREGGRTYYFASTLSRALVRKKVREAVLRELHVQYGEFDFLSMVEPHAPRLVTFEVRFIG